MSKATEQYIQYQEGQGSIMAEPSEMSKAQYDYILQLIDTCILADIQKDQIHEHLENGTHTADHASRLINELLQLQRSPLDRIRDGELLLMSDVKLAVRKAASTPNT